MIGGKIGILYRKELLDIIRDRKTLMLMILLPVLLYPLLMIGGLFLTTSVMNGPKHSTYVIGAHSEDLKDVARVVSAYEGDADISVVDLDLYEKKTDLQVEFDPGEEGKVLVNVFYDSSDTNSSSASSVFSDLLKKYGEKLTKDQLKKLDLDPERILDPLEIKRNDTATKEARAGFVIGMVLPFMLISSILMGALYPAIDTTAGEKERGTLETLMTLPITNYELITGKFLAVATVSICSALLNILSMGVCTFFLYTTAMDTLTVMVGKKEAELSLLSFALPVGVTMAATLTFAVFISALVLCMCLNTSSFKEAENISTPVILIVIVSSIAGVIPNLKLTSATALVPVVGTSILIRDAFSFHADLSGALLVIVSNLIYAALLVTLIGKMYRSERVLFGSREGKESIRFFAKRSEIEKVPGKMPGVGDALVLLVACLLAMFSVGSFLQVRFPSFGVLGNQIIFLAFSFFLAWYMKCDFRKVFSFRRPKGNPILAILSSILLWAGTYLIMLCMIVPLEQLFPESRQNLGSVEDLMNSMSPVMLIIGVGIAPAVCEEILFRGFLFGAFRERFGRVWAIVITSVLFGFYHLSLVKFFTTGLVGLTQGVILGMTGSIYLTMMVHGINNTISVLASYVCPGFFEEHASFLLTGFNGAKEVIPAMLLAVLLCSLGGLGLFLNHRLSEKMASGNGQTTEK